MTPQEILNEIGKLPLIEQERISADLSVKLKINDTRVKPKMTRDEFNRRLLAKGLITHIPAGETDFDDDFEPVPIDGEPLSETILRERR